MLHNDNLKQLMKLAEKSMEQINKEIRIFELTLDESIKNVDDNDKGEIESLKALSTKAINLAKMGKAEKAQEIIRNFQNGRKNSK